MIYVIIATHHGSYDENVCASTSRELLEAKLQELEEYNTRREQARNELVKWIANNPWVSPPNVKANAWQQSWNEECQRLADIYQIKAEELTYSPS